MNYFEEVKQATTPKEIRTELDCLTTISLNVGDYCNKSCSYCPHGQGYEPELNSVMSVATARKIRDRLQELKDKGVTPRLTISGMGEPFLNPDLEEILAVLQDFHPTVLTMVLCSRLGQENFLSSCRCMIRKKSQDCGRHGQTRGSVIMTQSLLALSFTSRIAMTTKVIS